MNKKAAKAIKSVDRRIEAAYYRTCSGMQINIMDIGKVFAKGRELVAAGVDDTALGEGLKACVNAINLAKG